MLEMFDSWAWLKEKTQNINKPSGKQSSYPRSDIQALRTADPPNRFLKRRMKTNDWNEVGDIKAMAKVKRVFQEKKKGLRMIKIKRREAIISAMIVNKLIRRRNDIVDVPSKQICLVIFQQRTCQMMYT